MCFRFQLLGSQKQALQWTKTTTGTHNTEAASPVRLVRLVRPRPDHFSAGCWSEDETIGLGVPRKLVFALHVRVSRNRSRSFISPPRVLRSATPRASRNASGTSLRLPRVLHFRASPPQTVHMHERSFICNGLTTFQMPAPPLQHQTIWTHLQH